MPTGSAFDTAIAYWRPASDSLTPAGVARHNRLSDGGQGKRYVEKDELSGSEAFADLFAELAVCIARGDFLAVRFGVARGARFVFALGMVRAAHGGSPVETAPKGRIGQ